MDDKKYTIFKRYGDLQKKFFERFKLQPVRNHPGKTVTTKTRMYQNP